MPCILKVKVLVTLVSVNLSSCSKPHIIIDKPEDFTAAFGSFKISE